MRGLAAFGAIVVLLVGADAAAQQAPAVRGAATPRAQGATGEARRISNDQLDIATYVSEQTVAPGARFSLVFEIAPRQGIHIYAPGKHAYKVIALRLNRNPLVTARPLRYPASETYIFAPLKEQVQVYRKPFRLTAEMALDGSVQGRKKLETAKSVTISGVLTYQACNDTLCFNPISVPVAYTVNVRAATSSPPE